MGSSRRDFLKTFFLALGVFWTAPSLKNFLEIFRGPKTFFVRNTKQFQEAIASCRSGDTIELAKDGVFESLVCPSRRDNGFVWIRGEGTRYSLKGDNTPPLPVSKFPTITAPVNVKPISFMENSKGWDLSGLHIKYQVNQEGWSFWPTEVKGVERLLVHHNHFEMIPKDAFTSRKMRDLWEQSYS